jgi:hypothetical protein
MHGQMLFIYRHCYFVFADLGITMPFDVDFSYFYTFLNPLIYWRFFNLSTRGLVISIFSCHRAGLARIPTAKGLGQMFYLSFFRNENRAAAYRPRQR